MKRFPQEAPTWIDSHWNCPRGLIAAGIAHRALFPQEAPSGCALHGE